jgi:hypothetical protein
MQEEKYRPFFRVVDTYKVKGHLVLVSDRVDSGAARTNEVIQVRTPCGGPPRLYQAGCVSVSGSSSTGTNPFCMAIKGVEPGEIPIGSRVWIEDRQSKKEDLSRYRKKTAPQPSLLCPEEQKGKMETV